MDKYLSGYKTYIVSILTIIGLIASYVAGHLDLAAMLQGITTPLIAMALRHGMETSTVEGAFVTADMIIDVMDEYEDRKAIAAAKV